MAKRETPSFRFIPEKWLTDSRVTLMNLGERGVYIQLLCYCCMDGFIPSEPWKLIRLAGDIDWTRENWDAIWKMVGPCFHPHPTDPEKLIHPELIREESHGQNPDH